MAANESENFAVYSNIHFLYLIGMSCQQGKQMHEVGLQALNDYLTLLNFTRSSFPPGEFEKNRALAFYQIAALFSDCGHYLHAKQYAKEALPVLQKYPNKLEKELSACNLLLLL
jgi:hypothetical protein